MGETIAISATCQLTMILPADPAAMAEVRDHVAGLLERNHWPADDVFAVQLAVQEAVANAIRHGCGGDAAKRVVCSLRCDDTGEAVVVVRDPGPGFDPGAVADPLAGANILKPSGRGIFLMRALMDDVQFADGGRELRMRKQRSPAERTSA
jgi:serine/threonine-protein kinase RsbW